jgi:ADP-ribosylglycohydrolase
MTANARVINSALWAAYGDALGFMTEFATEEIVRSKFGTAKVDSTISWERRIGGRFGTNIKLPAGCYSDDTQLRLATSRAIRYSGEFDPEAFSKVELPVWLAYQLGGGKGTKAAATSLVRRQATWSNNFWGKAGDYARGGGNGAAMRIQPHVWSARDLSLPEAYVSDVIRNAVITHGHPRGILGAVLHAILLAEVLRSGTVPAPSEWMLLISELRSAEQGIRQDDHFRTFWLPSWERMFPSGLREEFEAVITECHTDASVLTEIAETEPFDYCAAVRKIGGLSPTSRGSGTKTVLLALLLAWKYESDPEAAVTRAANCLGSDTDTIATLVGALVGAANDLAPTAPIMDREYISAEAERMTLLGEGRPAPNFQYPNLAKWNPPVNQSDVVGEIDGRMVVAGLGYVVESGERVPDPTKQEFAWQWLTLSHGQTILARLKLPLKELKPTSLAGSSSIRRQERSVPPQEDLFPHPTSTLSDRAEKINVRTDVQKPGLDEMTKRAIDNGFDPLQIGRTLLDLCDLPDGIEKAVAYAAIIAKAKRARSALRSATEGRR